MKALDVADMLVKYATYLNYPISHLHLQRIMYFLESYHIFKYNKKLYDEYFEAWMLGPILKTIYDKYSISGSNPIFVSEEDMKSFNIKALAELEEKTNKKIIINLIQTSLFTLINYSNAQDSAWAKTYDENDKFKRPIIDFKLLQQEAKVLWRKKYKN